MTNLKNISFDLNADYFAGYSRRKYDSQYTAVPVSSYPDAVAPIMEALAKALDQPVNSEPLTIVSMANYAQRIAGPRVCKKDGQLVLTYGRETLAITALLEEDEISYSVSGTKLTLIPGEKPAFVASLKGGLKVTIDVRTEYSETPISGKLICEQIDSGNYENVAEQKTGGVNFFSALKNMPVGKYLIAKTVLSTTGRFGPKQKIQVIFSEETQMKCSVSKDGIWSQELVTVPAGAKVTVDANTGLGKTLQGLELKESDNVFLDVISQKADELDPSKIYVSAAIDFSESKLAVSF